MQKILGMSLVLFTTEKERIVMSLVPILYTSIVLFAILMLIIVSISYIAYKVRNRNTNEDQRSESLRYITPTVQPAVRRSYQPQTIRVVQTIKNPEMRKTESSPLQSGRTTIITNINSSKPVEARQDRTIEQNYNQTGEYNRRTNSGSYKSRLEILNKVRPEEAAREKFTYNGSGSIALPKYYENFRAIQYYSDEDDEYLYKPSRYYH